MMAYSSRERQRELEIHSPADGMHSEGQTLLKLFQENFSVPRADTLGTELLFQVFFGVRRREPSISLALLLRRAFCS